MKKFIIAMIAAMAFSVVAFANEEGKMEEKKMETTTETHGEAKMDHAGKMHKGKKHVKHEKHEEKTETKAE